MPQPNARTPQTVSPAARTSPPEFTRTPEWSTLSSVYCAGCNLDILSRRLTDTEWEYAVIDDENRRLDKPGSITQAPGRVQLEDLLVKHGHLDRRPRGRPREWALCVDRSNDVPSNFLSEALMERAAIETAVEELASGHDASMTAFIIEPNGNQEDLWYKNASDLLSDHAIAKPQVKRKVSMAPL